MVQKDFLSKTAILWFILFLGCGVNYMIRTNINIAIVAMVRRRGASDGIAIASECFTDALNRTTNRTMNNGDIPTAEQIDDDESRFDWDEHQQNNVLGAFYWLYWSAQVPGGMLGQRYGSKKVFGFGNLFISVTTLLIPLFSIIDYRVLVTLRVLQGISGGFCWPSLTYMIARWVPPNERSKFLSAFMGSSVGSALTFPLCGTIIHFFNWQAAFYVTGTIGILWFIAWWLLVYDSPADHPTISEAERKRIQNALGDSISDKKLPIPWRKILTNRPLLVTIIAAWGCVWGMFTILTQAPTYFRNVHGWSIHMVGLLSGFPHICRMFFALLVGYVCDYLRANEKLSVTNIRKLAGFVMDTVQGFFMLGLAFSGCNSVAALICLTIALSCSGAEPSGSLSTYIDLSPNFSSILMGIGNMICVTPGFLSSALVGYLTYQNQTSEQWKKVFLISGVILIVPGLIHLLTASAELQEWNSPQFTSKDMMISGLEKDKEAQQHLTLEHESDHGQDNAEEKTNQKP